MGGSFFRGVLKRRTTMNFHIKLKRYPNFLIFTTVLWLVSCLHLITSEERELSEVKEACQTFYNTGYSGNYAEYLKFYNSKYQRKPMDSTTFIRWCGIIRNFKMEITKIEKRTYNSIKYYAALTTAWTQDRKEKLMEKYTLLVKEDHQIFIASPLSLFTQGWETIKTKYFDIYTNQKISDSALADIDSFYEAVSKELKVSPTEPVEFYLCKDKRESGLLQNKKEPAGGTCFPGKPITIISPALSYHEIVHSIAYNISDRSLDFLVEGLATYYMFIRKPWKLDSIVGQMKSFNELLPLDTLIWKFRSLPETLAYFQAASFVKFLIENYGRDAFITLYKQAGSWDEFLETLPKLYERTLDELENEWINWLQ
jgi:hypothetical protein